MTSSATPSSQIPSPRTRPRPPSTIVAIIVILVPRAALGAFGLVLFGVFATDINPAAGSPPAVAFAAIGLVYAITALASLPGLWRGRRVAWHLLTCVTSAMILFGAYKGFVEGEADTVSILFAVADPVVAILLCLPSTRRHVDAG